MKRYLAALAAILTLAPAAALAQQKGSTQVTWYGQATFVVRTPKGKVIVIDPWFANPLAKDKEAGKKLEKVDFILVSHGHFDHANEAIELGQRTGAKLVSVFELATALVASGYPKDKAGFAAGTAGNIGGTIPLDDEVQVTLAPAIHSSTFVKDPNDPNAQALPGGVPAGFVVEIQGGPTIYHTGDTDVTGDMRLLGERFRVDLMLACIGGHFTMGPKGAARAVSLVNPKQVVPMHFGTFSLLRGTPAELKQELARIKAKAQLVEMTIGEPRRF